MVLHPSSGSGFGGLPKPGESVFWWYDPVPPEVNAFLCFVCQQKGSTGYIVLSQVGGYVWHYICHACKDIAAMILGLANE